MVQLRTFKLNSDSTALSVVAQGSLAITGGRIWKVADFKSPTKYYDITSLITEDLIVSFDVPASFLGETFLTGMYYIEIGYEDITDAGWASNLTSFSDCILNKSLVMIQDINGCEEVNDICEECQENLCLAHTRLTALRYAILNSFDMEIKDLYLALKQSCTQCETCPDEEVFPLTTGNSVIVDETTQKIV